MREQPHSEEYIFGRGSAKEIKAHVPKMIRFGMFEEESFKKIREYAREKSSIERQMIAIIHKKTNELLEYYGAEPLVLPENSVHVIPRELWNKLPDPLNQEDVYGWYFPTNESFVIKEQDTMLDFARAVFHESGHLKSYQTALVETDPMSSAILFSPLRIGISLEIKQKQPDNSIARVFVFSSLNEAVTEELTKRFIWDLIDSTEGKKVLDFDKQSGVVAYRKEESEEYYYTDIRHDENGTIIASSYGGYIRERRILWALIDKLYKHNKNKFQNREGIFDLFAKAALVGKSLDGLELTKLIEKTFWKGVVREFAALEGNLDEQEKFIQALP